MIDFRFHLISIIGVFLALALGILTGSGFLGDALVKDLEKRVEDVRKDNDELHAEVNRLNERIDTDRDFMEEIEPQLIEGALQGRPVVVFEFEGTSDGTADDARDAIEDAGGRVASTITLTDKLALAGAPERDQLALIVGSTSDETPDLLEQTGSLMGLRVAAAAEPGGGEDASTTLDQLLEDLEDARFVSVNRDDPERTVPGSSLFLVIAGDSEDAGLDASLLSLALASGIAQRDGAILVAETSDSIWGVVSSIRGDGDIRDEIATVDQAETIPGRIGIVLGLRLELDGDVPAGHYGTDDGATSIIPPLPGS